MIEVLFFAAIKEKVGQDKWIVEEELMTIGQLKSKLLQSYPDLKQELNRSMFAVNEQFAEDDTRLHSGDQVAIIPPVSGG